MCSLDNIRAFIRAVELGGFSAAGRSMRLSAAVISHRIQSLERHLGTRLFNRTTRKMHITEQGKIFYENAIEVCHALERAEASISDKGATPRGLLKVTAPLGFGRRVVAPLLPRFQQKYPELDVFLRLSDYQVDLLTETVDVAVRMAILTDSSLIIRKISDIERVICAAPSYLERHGAPKLPADLEKHRCLSLRYPGVKQYKWLLRIGKEVVPVPVSSRLDTDDGEVLTEWALAGEGIMIKSLFEVAKHLKSGELVPVLPKNPPVPVTLAVLHAYQRMVPPKVSAFADALIQDARAYLDESLAVLSNPKSEGRRKK